METVSGVAGTGAKSYSRVGTLALLACCGKAFWLRAVLSASGKALRCLAGTFHHACAQSQMLLGTHGKMTCCFS